MEFLFIFGLSVKQYANLLFYGGIAVFIVIGLPIVYLLGKALEKVNKSNFNPIDYIYGRPQRYIPDEDIEIEIKITKSKEETEQPAPDNPQEED